MTPDTEECKLGIEHSTGANSTHLLKDTPDTEWRAEYNEFVKDVREYGDFPEVLASHVEKFIEHLISSRDTYWKERVEELERDFIIFKRPECNVKDFLAQGGDGQLHRLMEINPKEALDTLLDNLK